jgi:hypothetical protein
MISLAFLAALAELPLPPPAAPPVPPPLPQQVADCRSPVYASDMLVCADPDLRRLDADLTTLLAEAPHPAGPWMEPQDAWFRRSRMCAFRPDHAGCLSAAYMERIGVLRPTQPSPMAALRCKPRDITGSLQPEGLLLRNGEGERLGLAAPASRDWRPFLELRPAKGQYEIFDQAGRRVAYCHAKWLTLDWRGRQVAALFLPNAVGQRTAIDSVIPNAPALQQHMPAGRRREWSPTPRASRPG